MRCSGICVDRLLDGIWRCRKMDAELMESWSTRMIKDGVPRRRVDDGGIRMLVRYYEHKTQHKANSGHDRPAGSNDCCGHCKNSERENPISFLRYFMKRVTADSHTFFFHIIHQTCKPGRSSQGVMKRFKKEQSHCQILLSKSRHASIRVSFSASLYL
jgi:hypothetical protein